jgi:hypothetical protein
MRKFILLTFICFTMLVAMGQDKSAPASVVSSNSSDPCAAIEHAFVKGGRITLALGAGGYDVVGSQSSKIAVRCTTPTTDGLKHVRLEIRVNGQEAHVTAQGPHNNFQVTIEVPVQSDIYARLSAGELKFSGVEGNKDAEIHAGTLQVEVPRTDEYARVNASVNIGSVEARAWSVDKGGFFRSFHTTGPGRYSLRAHVGTGEVVLKPSM